MLVKDYMTRHPIMIPPTTPAAEAERIISENKVRHLPVVGDGKRLEGLITRQRLALKPDTLASLDVWEITRYLSDLTVNQIMVPARSVQTIGPDRTIERAARTMSEQKVGCLPVIGEGIVVGILSEVDLLRAFEEMLGLRAEGVRVTIRMPNQKGEFAKLTTTVAQQGWGIMGIGTFPSPRHPGYHDAVLKIPNVTSAEVHQVLSQVPEQEVVDVRETV